MQYTLTNNSRYEGRLEYGLKGKKIKKMRLGQGTKCWEYTGKYNKTKQTLENKIKPNKGFWGVELKDRNLSLLSVWSAGREDNSVPYFSV